MFCAIVVHEPSKDWYSMAVVRGAVPPTGVQLSVKVLADKALAPSVEENCRFTVKGCVAPLGFRVSS